VVILSRSILLEYVDTVGCFSSYSTVYWVVSYHQELVERTQCQVLAARGVTALLIQSTLTPDCGNPLNSSFEYFPRNKPLAFFASRSLCRLLMSVFWFRVTILVDSIAIAL